MSDQAPILYWFPGLQDESRIPAPYAERFLLCRNIARDSYGPPDGAGKRGLLVSPRPGCCVYRPAAQRWLRVATVAGQEVWLGARLGMLPAELRRATSWGGVPVRLGDGQDWDVPVCNPEVASCRLPGYDARVDGQWTRVVDAAYQQLAGEAAALAGVFREQLLAGENPGLEVDTDEFRDRVARILGLNYDITADEIGVLALMREAEHYAGVVAAWVDLEAMAELLIVAMSQAQEARPGAALNPFAVTSGTSATASGAPATAPTSPP